MIPHVLSAILALSPFSSEAPCRGCQDPLENSDDRDLLLFISLSAPVETWKDHSAEIERTGGVFVLRGMAKGESFETLPLKILELKAKGVNAPIDIDPDSFVEYAVEAVPAIVVRDGEKWDKVSGNIPVHTALEMMKESGDAKKTASQLLKKWKEPGS